jgi:homoserine dehydrogenase
VVTVARNRLNGVTGVGESTYAELQIASMGDTVTRYHVGIDVDDKPGVLASVAELFALHGVSIQTVHQEGRGNDARLVVVTHAAPDRALSATVESLRGLTTVREVTSVMRVEGVTE